MFGILYDIHVENHMFLFSIFIVCWDIERQARSHMPEPSAQRILQRWSFKKFCPYGIPFSSHWLLFVLSKHLR